MSLEFFVAGRYTGTYNATDIGITNDGIEIQQESRWEAIEASDNYGDSIIDGVYRGGNCYLQAESKAYKPGSLAPFWPWGGMGALEPSIGGSGLGIMQWWGGSSGVYPIGRLASSVAQSMILTAIANTAFNNTPANAIVNTLTAPLAILAPNFSARLLFHTRLRQVPLRLLALPYEVSFNGATLTRWFAIT